MPDDSIFIKFIDEQLSLPLPLAEEIVENFEYVKIQKNDFLLINGTICNKYMFIHKGFMRSYIVNENGKEITTNFFPNVSKYLNLRNFLTVQFQKKISKQLRNVQGGQ